MIRLFAISFVFSLSAQQANSQSSIDELAGTRQRLSMTCLAIILAAPDQMPAGVSQEMQRAINANRSLRRPGETNTMLRERFVDFHAQGAGLIAGQMQSRELVDQAYRSSFLVSQMAASGDTESVRRIAEACVALFSSDR